MNTQVCQLKKSINVFDLIIIRLRHRKSPVTSSPPSNDVGGGDAGGGVSTLSYKIAVEIEDTSDRKGLAMG